MCVIMIKLRFTLLNDLQVRIRQQTSYYVLYQCCAKRIFLKLLSCLNFSSTSHNASSSSPDASGSSPDASGSSPGDSGSCPNVSGSCPDTSGSSHGASGRTPEAAGVSRAKSVSELLKI